MTNQIKRRNNDLSNFASRVRIGFLAAMLLFGLGHPALADITNSAVAVGTFGGSATSSAPDTTAVPVIGLSPDMTIVNSITTAPDGTSGAGDLVLYQYVVTNSGNQTLTNVSPVDSGPTFNGNAGTGTMGAFSVSFGNAASLAPGESVTFTASYTLSALDIYRAAGVNDGVSNAATSTSTEHTDGDGNTVVAAIPANPSLTIAKVAVLNDESAADSLAEVGETITYTYTVTNNGNVALTNVGVQDTHEGVLLTPAPAGETIVTEGPVRVSAFGSADDGVIDQLEAGAVATFTYVHTVTQAEIDNQ
ncbi:MAG: hypothetical protein QM488_16855 [Rhizobiaceae bacterium]